MTKRFLGAVALGVGLALVPVTVRSGSDSNVPTLAVSEACAETGTCCPSPGDFCLRDGQLISNMRPSLGQACAKKPGT